MNIFLLHPLERKTPRQAGKGNSPPTGKGKEPRRLRPNVNSWRSCRSCRWRVRGHQQGCVGWRPGGCCWQWSRRTDASWGNQGCPATSAPQPTSHFVPWRASGSTSLPPPATFPVARVRPLSLKENLTRLFCNTKPSLLVNPQVHHGSILLLRLPRQFFSFHLY